MSKRTVHMSPHRRLVFTDTGVSIEEEQKQDTGTKWVSLATLNGDELEQLFNELETAGYPA